MTQKSDSIVWSVLRLFFGVELNKVRSKLSAGDLKIAWGGQQSAPIAHNADAAAFKDALLSVMGLHTSCPARRAAWFHSICAHEYGSCR